MSARALRRLLVLQKPEVLSQQERFIREFLQNEMPETDVHFAGKQNDVPAERFDAVLAPTLPWLPEALDRVEGAGWVHFLSAGVERIWDMPVDWSGWSLSKSSGIHGPQMSEYAIGAMLHFAKGFDRFVDQSRRREWSRFWLSELTGQTVMVLGAGHMGAWVVRRCQTFGMRTVAVQRRPRPVEGADRCLSWEQAQAELGEVHHLVVCVPLTDQTRGMVDAGVLTSLAHGAVLVDLSRGGVVSGEGVLAALDAGHLRGAALDVFETQPLPPDSPLWDRPDVLVTPHVAGTSPHYLARALGVFVENARAWVQGEALPTRVDPVLRY